MKKYSQSELKEIFGYGLKTVASILGIDASKVSRDKYTEVCKEKGIKYVNPYTIGGFTKVREELTAEGAFDDMEEATSDEEIKASMREKLYNFIRENNFVPNKKGFKEYSNFTVTAYYEDMHELYLETKQEFPDIEEFLFNETNYTEVYKECLTHKIANHNSFIITSAVCGKNVDDNFYNSLRTLARKNKAMVLVIPIAKKTKNSLFEWNLDPKLKEFNVIFEPVQLNNNLMIWDMRVKAEQATSLSGVDRALTGIDTSIIVASTKLEMKYVPTRKGRIPRMIASTGCCTENDYKITGYMPVKSTKLAEVTHKLGALFVKIVDNKIYHCRNIEASPNGEIIDLCKLYKPDGKVENVHNLTMVMGDLHVPKYNVELVNAHLKMISKLNVSTVVLHDTVNMGAISHHNKDKMCLKALQALKGENTIIGEANALNDILTKFCRVVKNVVVPYSNHPDHLNRYLEEARFVNDSVNFYVSLDLAKAYMDGKNVLAYLMNKVGFKANNIKWLEEDESYKIYGVECGFHGHQRTSGGSTNLMGFSKALGKNIIAHKHTPSIKDNTFVVGITCEEEQQYNTGFGAWMATSALLSPTGTVQLINFLNIDGKYNCGD